MKIIIPNERKFEEKVEMIKKKGADSLHIVSDFDNTLTYGTGTSARSTWGHFSFSPEYEAECRRLHDFYHPIEHNPALPLALKQEKITEWYESHMKLLQANKLSKSVISDVVSKGLVNIRKGVDEFLHLAALRKVPCLIFSGGLGDVIEEAFRQAKLLSPSLHIVSNFFTFDKEGKVNGFKNEPVCSVNKCEYEVKGKPYEKEIKSRSSVLLLGDLLTDIDMTKGIPHETVIRVGFLNGKKEKLEHLKKGFDVILAEDGDMEYAVNLLLDLTS